MSGLMDRFFKGILYKSELAYRAATLLKFRSRYRLRFELAAQYVTPGDRVLEVCSAFGELKGYLPKDCTYTCVDASTSFINKLKTKNIPVVACDLHKGLDVDGLKADVVLMVVSLSQFKYTSVHDLLESFKTIARKVVIIECVGNRKKESFMNKLVDYLSATDYYHPTDLFTHSEFEKVLGSHKYDCRKHDHLYSIGFYGA